MQRGQTRDAYPWETMSPTHRAHGGRSRDYSARGPRGDLPRLLFLSERFLFPLDSGGKIRTAKLLEHLQTWFDITLVGHFDPGGDGPWLEDVNRVCTEFH